jgi:hypothetical protein
LHSYGGGRMRSSCCARASVCLTAEGSLNFWLEWCVEKGFKGEGSPLRVQSMSSSQSAGAAVSVAIKVFFPLTAIISCG